MAAGEWRSPDILVGLFIKGGPKPTQPHIQYLGFYIIYYISRCVQTIPNHHFFLMGVHHWRRMGPCRMPLLGCRMSTWHWKFPKLTDWLTWLTETWEYEQLRQGCPTCWNDHSKVDVTHNPLCSRGDPLFISWRVQHATAYYQIGNHYAGASFHFSVQSISQVPVVSFASGCSWIWHAWDLLLYVYKYELKLITKSTNK